jgi:hypothetical protein
MILPTIWLVIEAIISSIVYLTILAFIVMFVIRRLKEHYARTMAPVVLAPPAEEAISEAIPAEAIDEANQL